MVDDCGQGENADYLCLMEQVYQTSQNTQTIQKMQIMWISMTTWKYIDMLAYTGSDRNSISSPTCEPCAALSTSTPRNHCDDQRLLTLRLSDCRIGVVEVDVIEHTVSQLNTQCFLPRFAGLTFAKLSSQAKVIRMELKTPIEEKLPFV